MSLIQYLYENGFDLASDIAKKGRLRTKIMKLQGDYCLLNSEFPLFGFMVLLPEPLFLGNDGLLYSPGGGIKILEVNKEEEIDLDDLDEELLRSIGIKKIVPKLDKQKIVLFAEFHDYLSGEIINKQYLKEMWDKLNYDDSELKKSFNKLVDDVSDFFGFEKVKDNERVVLRSKQGIADIMFQIKDKKIVSSVRYHNIFGQLVTMKFQDESGMAQSITHLDQILDGLNNSKLNRSLIHLEYVPEIKPEKYVAFKKMLGLKYFEISAVGENMVFISMNNHGEYNLDQLNPETILKKINQ